MRRANPRADETLAAIRLAQTPARLAAVSAPELVAAAAVLARAVVHAIDSAGLPATRAAAVDVLDNAGKQIGKELRRRS